MTWANYRNPFRDYSPDYTTETHQFAIRTWNFDRTKIGVSGKNENWYFFNFLWNLETISKKNATSTTRVIIKEATLSSLHALSQLLEKSKIEEWKLNWRDGFCILYHALSDFLIVGQSEERLKRFFLLITIPERLWESVRNQESLYLYIWYTSLIFDLCRSASSSACPDAGILSFNHPRKKCIQFTG